jgi:RNA polymerase sigma-70 factor (ECF subfamily)
VFVLREVHGIRTAETAELLQVTAGTVKTRLHRARHRLQQDLRHVAPAAALRFDGRRRDRSVEAAMRQLAGENLRVVGLLLTTTSGEQLAT